MRILRSDEVTADEGSARYVEQLRVEALSVGTYVIPAGAPDLQSPHTEDEIYVVLSGRGSFTSGSQTRPVGTGDVLYVPRLEAHRFHDVTEQLVLCVVFAPPEGSTAT